MPAPSDAEIHSLFVHPDGTRLLRARRHAWRPDALARVSLLRSGESDGQLRERSDAVRRRLFAADGDTRERHAVATLVALVVGDALGAPLEFRVVSYDPTAQPRLAGFDEATWRGEGCNRFQLKPGQWTDDASMALCFAESLMARGRLDPHDLRLRFVLWWHLGYCNAFGYDPERAVASSVGLGGNIGASFEEFFQRETMFTGAGDRDTSGNGSLMRLAPAAVFFSRAPAGETPAQRRRRYDDAMALAYWQSKTTHQGDEAAECCRLMVYVMLASIDAACEGLEPKSALAALPGSFESPLYSVQCLAASMQEDRHASNASAELEDRDWRWRAPSYRFSPSRARAQPGYVGSYAMDALAMALHCAWTAGSPSEAMLKCANMRGDADTTTAITGQIVGAMYGLAAVPREWIARVERWDPLGLVLLRACRLYNREHEPQRQFGDTSWNSATSTG
ncbi:ADP-ribosylglycohydrolase-domain-containing protein [Hyaloraphidium curvatum]|nr:ADP-ribosylglycohydrolase-domain-containing protein [Hyaloraphidium curvatum]